MQYIFIQNNIDKDQINIGKIDLNKEITKTSSCLEFFVILLSNNLSLPVKQTISLFTNNNKYLAYLFAKGVKSLFDPIIQFYQEVYMNIPHLIKLFNEDNTRQNITFTMNCLKPGIISKNIEVSSWTARLFSKMGFELADTNLFSTCWDWFISEHGGLQTCLLGLKRHPDLKELILSVLLQFAKFNFVELFTIFMKRVQVDSKDLISVYFQILKPLTQSDLAKEEMLSTGILDEWIDQAIQYAEEDYKNIGDTRIISLQFIGEVWILFPFKIEENENRYQMILSLFTNASKSKITSLIISCLTVLFELLDQFATLKSPSAPNIYRILTLSLIENHQNIQIREFMLYNFIQIYSNVENIPFNILLEPLIRQIQVSENITYFYNVIDFEFFNFICQNEKLQFKNAIQILDLLFKIYLNNVVFANSALFIILSLIKKYIENETLNEFLIKFVKVALAMFYASEKKKKPKEKNLPLYNNKSPAQNVNNLLPVEIDNEIFQAQKRAQIIQIIKSIVQLNNMEINEKIMPLVAHTNIQIKVFMQHNCKGMLSILQYFGDPEQILEKYEIEYKEHQQQLLKEEKERKEIEDQNQNYNNLDIEQQDILKSVENNIKKYALLRNPKADPKILKNLIEIKNNFINKQEMKQLKAQQELDDFGNKKDTLRKILIKRSLEQGVASYNQRDVEAKILFEYGSRQKQLKRENNTGLYQIQYIDLNLEEERDKNMIQIILRRYHKVLKNIFVKYSNSGFSVQFTNQNINSFDNIKQHSSMISVPEIYQFVKYYEFSDLLSNEEHKVLVRLVATKGNRKLLKKNIENISQEKIQEEKQKQNMFEKNSQKNQWNYAKNDIKDVKAFDFFGFQDYIVQLSSYIYTKLPNDFRHLPLNCSLQKLFDHMRFVTKNKNKNTALFDDPDNQYFGESEVIKEYNKKLQQNPDYPLPKGYKKIKEKQLKFDYNIDKQGNIPIKESFKYAYIFLNELLNEKLGFHLIEPKSIIKEVVKAQPIIQQIIEVEAHYLDHFKYPETCGKKQIKSINQSMQIDNQGPKDSTKSLPSTLYGQKKYSDKRVLEIDSLHNLNLTMKLVISQYSYKDKYTAEQCAFCLDDVIKAVENKKDSVSRYRKFDKQSIKEEQEEEEEEKHKKKSLEKRLKNHEFIQMRAKEIQQQNELLEKDKKEKENKIKQQKEIQEKKWVEDNNKFWQQKKESYEKLKAKKIEDEKRILEELYKKQQEEKDKKEKEFQEFNKNQIIKLKETQQKQKEKEKQMDEEYKKLEQYQKKLREKLFMKIVKDSEERIEIEKIANNKIKDLIESQEIQYVFKENEFKISQLFSYLKKYNYRVISRQDLNDEEIDFKTFNWFVYRFNIYPEVITNAKDILLIFRSITRNKQVIDNKPIGVNEKEFKEALVRLAIKGKKIFNKFSEKIEKGENLNQLEMENIANKENNMQKNNQLDDSKTVKTQKTEALEKMKNVIDDYGNIEEAKSCTLESLIYYLGLPNDKLGISEALKNVIESKPKPDQHLKRDLNIKIQKDPKDLIRYNPVSSKKNKNGSLYENNISIIQDKQQDQLIEENQKEEDVKEENQNDQIQEKTQEN
ncbi:hypothetical protein IMG5_106360 [Ichthyophthirius multifiliis]|uniref:Uncharacterized protein n=1 Tax=Ichthyophthirius multifiliis TaxID=5932 RepID=G0QT59_ICHMU|nr:hypothetical protein IMG5_106360 [Ichthyophthirius multifiliis]EGR31584.1 hypothetical protein IMG5_106360 [Ichthyophthirius multifiliis]|eukprot:XP_004035070.1 hypothetical protein IMG5_106360 [Ichthyophthirius multifiliis]